MWRLRAVFSPQHWSYKVRTEVTITIDYTYVAFDAHPWSRYDMSSYAFREPPQS